MQKQATAGSPVLSGSLEDALNHAFDSICALSPIKGINAAVQIPDGSVWKRAHGIGSEIPFSSALTPNHLMGMGSITKTFVATTLLLLTEDGLLGLDDSIGQFTDPYPNVPGHATVRQLLSHRTGISDYLNENPAMTTAWFADPDSIWEADTILYHYVLPPNFPVDSAWSYSNTNYLLAGRIIENLTGKPWYQVVRERILDSLALTHTFAFPWEMPVGQPISHGWADLDGNGTVDDLQGLGLPLEGLFSIGGSAGCLMTTPADIARFNERLFGGHLLKPATLADMQTDYSQTPATGFQYGLGAYTLPGLQPLDNWGHDGRLIYQSFALYFPDENLSIAVQQNDDRNNTPQTPMKDLVDVFLTLLLTYLDYDPPTAVENPAPDNSLLVFPNPTSGAVTMQFAGLPSKTTHLTVVNTVGQVVLAKQQVTGLATSLDLSGLPKGLYFLRLQSGMSVSSVRLVVQ